MKILLLSITFALLSIIASYSLNRFSKPCGIISRLTKKYPPKSSFGFTSTPTSPSYDSFRYNRILESYSKLHFKVVESDNEVATEDDENEEIEFETISGTNILNRISKGVIPIAASIGFAATPSSSLAIRLAGATIGGVSGLLAKRMLIDKYLKEKAASNSDEDDPPYSNSVANALSQLIESPKIMSFTSADVEMVAKKNKVPAEELSILFTFLFSEILYLATDSETKDLTELVDVLDFAANLQLTASEIGDGFALATVRVGKLLEVDERGFFTAEYPENILLQASKIFFLGEKLIGEFKGFYGKRLETALYVQFPQETYNEVISTACKYLFKRCIENVLMNPNSLTVEEVSTLREYITTSPEISLFRPANMQNMILEAVQFAVDSNIKDIKASEANIINYDNLVQAQKVLGWDNMELISTIERKTLPVFESAAKHVIDEIFLYPDRGMKYDEFFTDRINALHIDPNRARVIITNLLSDKNKEYMTTIDRVYSASKGNLEPVYKLMLNYARTYSELKRITATVMDDIKLPIPGLPFADVIRANLYELKLVKSDRAITVEDDMFDLSEKQQELVRKSIALPKVTSWVLQCMKEGNFDTNAKNAYQKLLIEYNVSIDEWQNTAIDFYYQQVSEIASTKAVPGSTDLDRLVKIREFLDISSDSRSLDLVSKVHLELFGEKYVKALNECMTPTGVIAEEYVASLERLRNRLGLTLSDAKTLLAYTVRQRMIPTVKGLLQQYQSSIDPKKLAEKQAKRMKAKQSDPISSVDNTFGFLNNDGDDDEDGSDYSTLGLESAQKIGGGPNVFMREALNFIDFFEQNFKILNMEFVSASGLIKISSTTSETGSSNSESLQDGLNIPVRATGILPESDLIDILKHYIITRITERDDTLRARYQVNEQIFAEALGISKESQVKVYESLAYSTKKKVFKNILRYKDGLSTQDIQQFAALKENLYLSKEKADLIYYQAAKGAVIEYSKELFNPSAENTPLITAAIAKRFREQIQSFGLDIQKDTGFNDRLITYLYALEVQNLVESGQIDSLQEAQEGYGIPEDKASNIIESACKRYLNQLFNLALRASKKYDEKDSVRWLGEIVKYAQFVSNGSVVDCDGNLFSEKDKDRLLGYLDSNRDVLALPSVEDKNAEETEDIVERIRRIINLTDYYIAPLSGIQGLLGGMTNLNELMVADPSENRKRWAWG